MPAALRDAGWAIEVHDDHFTQTTKDVELLPAVASHEWVFLTQDARIRYRTREAEALRKAGLKVFVIASANLTAEQTAAVLAKARKRIERTAESETAPFIYRVAKDGSVKRVE